MTYIGEHTFIGQFGHFLVVLATVAALFSAVAYIFSARAEKTGDLAVVNSWKKMGRAGFAIHGLSVFGIIACMFVMLVNGYYEYDYVWKHRNNEMPMKYILSCFWEGQQGSFLLWSFWHVILGGILLLKQRVWESRVMAVFGIIQMFLSMMLLGIYFGDQPIGSSPFTLVRELPENIGLPWTQMENYLQAIPMFSDGKGLNPLLQNYWMTIHPPTLFLGFASTLVPFAFAVAGMWKRDEGQWVKPALPWTFFSIAVLGLGVLMGGAWAYEALSFGGFWAWDPVENASLVPWLVLVAAGHVMLITSNKAGSWFTTALLCILTFIFIIYSTFLTRSGVLGDASVHSFTGDGMLGQLLIGLLLIIWGSLNFMIRSFPLRVAHSVLALLCAVIPFVMDGEMISGICLIVYVVGVVGILVYDYSMNWPKVETEESVLSREFWIFMGSIVLILSAIQISVQTSLPVFGKMFGTSWTLATEIEDRAEVFHQFQIPFAIVLTLMIGISQYLKYRKSEGKALAKKLTIPFIASAALTLLFTLLLGYTTNQAGYIVLLFSSFFAVTCNIDYWVRILKGNIKLSGSPIAHIGFGLLLAGALISTSKSEKITSTSYDIGALEENLNNNESVLMVQGDTVAVGPYFAIYHSKSMEGVNMHFEMEYLDSKPRDYREGDLIFTKDGIYESTAAHQTAETFEEDRDKYWKLIKNPTASHMGNARPWIRKPGNTVFTLYPVVQTNERMGNVPEPATRHWLTKDLYTHLQYAILDMPDTSGNDWEEPEDVVVAIKEDFEGPEGIRLHLDTVVQIFDYAAYGLDTSDFGVITRVQAYTNTDTVALEALTIIDANNQRRDVAATDSLLGVQFTVKEFSTNRRNLTLSVRKKKMPFTDFVVMQAIIFPYINILWIGCILMVLGTLIAVWQRVKRYRKGASA